MTRKAAAKNQKIQRWLPSERPWCWRAAIEKVMWPPSAEMIAVAARHAGFDVVYGGIRMSAEELIAAALEEDADVIGLSLLSGAHLEITQQVLDGLAAAGAPRLPVIVGGIIPEEDRPVLLERGVRAVFTPRDFDLMAVMARILDVLEAA